MDYCECKVSNVYAWEMETRRAVPVLSSKLLVNLSLVSILSIYPNNVISKSDNINVCVARYIIV